MQDSEHHHQSNEADIYKRIKLLGKGSYGRAFLVRDKQNGEEWVIKQIDLSDMLKEQQEAALKEAKILEMLNHSNIVRFREVYRTVKMKLNIVMQYAGGGDLAERIKTAKEGNNHFSEKQILEWFVQICSALRYIHCNKIIHRDLKPHNIFLTEGGFVKLGDFGVAKVLEHTAGKANTVVGSPYYISPQIINNKPYSFKTDIWSLGTVLYQMCALEPPFKGCTRQQLSLRILRGVYSPLPRIYSEGLKNLVKKMLQIKQFVRPTINHILSEKIVIDTIKRLNGNQIVNVPRGVIHTVSSFPKLNPLNLSPNSNDNQSNINQIKNTKEQECSGDGKSQTPRFVSKNQKIPNHRLHPPVSHSSRKQDNSEADLTGVFQIKPSVKHERQQRPHTPYSALLRVSPIKQKHLVISKSALDLNHIENKKSSYIISSKRRFSYAKDREVNQNERKKKEVVRVDKTFEHIRMRGVKIDKEHKRSNIPKKTCIPQQKKMGIKFANQRELTKNQNVPYSDQRKPAENGQQFSDRPVVSKREPQVKSKSKGPSLNTKPSRFQNQEISEIQSIGNSKVDLTFSMSNEKSNLDFKKMIEEFNKIQQIVEAGGNIDHDDNFGSSIPELLNLSAEIREDDEQLENCPSSQMLPDHEPQPFQGSLNCLETPAQLEQLRMKLQQLFGVEGIIVAYQIIEKKMEEKGLSFDEDQAITQILQKRNEIKEEDLRKCIGHIVGIISHENKLA